MISMAQHDGVALSVRGEAHGMVEPDAVLLAASIAVWRNSKLDALTAASLALDRFTADLSELGGVPRTVGTYRSTLTWSAVSATTHPEQEHDERTGRPNPTGRILATVGVEVCRPRLHAAGLAGTRARPA
jgi:hypothetical protein